MTDETLLKRIVINQNVMVGKPVIKGTRLTVEFILNILAHGETITEILNEYHDLTLEDIHACILFASKAIEDSSYMPLTEAVA